MVKKTEHDEMKVESTIRRCVSEQLDKILNTGIANSLKLLQLEASLRTQSMAVERLTSRLEETADFMQRSLLEVKRKLEDIQVIGALMEEKGPVSEAPPSSLKSKDPMVTINKIAFVYDKFTHNFFLCTV